MEFAGWTEYCTDRFSHWNRKPNINIMARALKKRRKPGGKVRVRATLPPLSHCLLCCTCAWREGMGVGASLPPLSHNCCCQHRVPNIYIVALPG